VDADWTQAEDRIHTGKIMGYSLHLEKNGSPGDESGPFTLAEWTALRAIPGFPACATFMDGWIEAKNPSPPEIAFLVNAAKTYGWTVRGDDGETYAPDGRAIPPAAVSPPSLLQRLKALFREDSISNTMRARGAASAPFRAGDRVRTANRSGGVVVSIDPEANFGLGAITVRFPDGVELRGLFVGHGFELEG